LSVTTGVVQLATALHCPTAALRLILAGQLNVGASASFTVMVKEQEAELPDGSVTVYEIVETPLRNTLPGPEPALTGVKVPQLSLPVAGSVHVTGFPHAPGAVVVTILLGHTMVGN